MPSCFASLLIESAAQQVARDRGRVGRVSRSPAVFAQAAYHPMEQFVDEAAGERFDSCALCRFQAVKPCAMTPQLAVPQLLDTGTDILDSRNQIEPVEPFHERVEFELHDNPRLPR